MMVIGSGEEMRSNEFVRFIIMGNYLPKTRQNWFFGIRTLWALSSQVTWEKTHGLAGRLFFLTGLSALSARSS